MPDLISLFSDWLLEPVWAWFGVDGDSLLGHALGWAVGAVVSALGAAALTGLHLLWRATRRYRDRQAIGRTRDQAPAALLILVSDFAGKGGEEWGRNIIDRLQPDFEALGGAGPARLHHWTERFAAAQGDFDGRRFERSVARARRALKDCRADLLIWGRFTGAVGLRLHVVSATEKGPRPDVTLDFATHGQTQLTHEMGEAIAFFASQATGKRGRDLSILDGAALVTLATKLHALVTKPPRGLTPSQVAQIESAFDEAGLSADKLAFPSRSVVTALYKLRLRCAESQDANRNPAAFATAWARWAELGAQGGASYRVPAIVVAEKLAGTAEDRAKLHLAAAEANSLDSSYQTDTLAQTEAEAVLSLPVSQVTKAVARIRLSTALSQLGSRTAGNEGRKLLLRARDVAMQAIRELQSGSQHPAEWAEAHVAVMRSMEILINKLEPPEIVDAVGRTIEILSSGLRSVNANFAPRPASRIESALANLIDGYARLDVTTLALRIDMLKKAADFALSARSKIPKESSRSWAMASHTLSKVYFALGELERSPLVLKQASEVAKQAAAVEPLAWGTVYLALLVRAQILSGDNRQVSEARAALKSALEIMSRMSELPTVTTVPANAANLADHTALARRLLAQLAVAPSEATRLYNEAAAAFQKASHMHSTHGDRRAANNSDEQAQQCRNLAIGEGRSV